MKKQKNVFGKVLRDIRTERCQTQEALAFASDLDRTYISLLEVGSRSPTLDTMMAICSALDVSLTEMCRRIEDAMRSDDAS